MIKLSLSDEGQMRPQGDKMNRKKIMGSLFFSVLVAILLLIGNIASNPENPEWSRAVFFVS
jgi:hypothetical protein